MQVDGDVRTEGDTFFRPVIRVSQFQLTTVEAEFLESSHLGSQFLISASVDNDTSSTCTCTVRVCCMNLPVH